MWFLRLLHMPCVRFFPLSFTDRNSETGFPLTHIRDGEFNGSRVF